MALAAEAGQRAAEAPTEALRVDHDRLAKTWRHLANSYLFVESLERFMLDVHKARRVQQPAPANENRDRRLPPADTSFSPETIAVLSAVFEMAIDGQPTSAHESIAKHIINLASKGERDPERLCRGALDLLMREPRSIS